MTTTEKLYQTVQDLPEPALAELLDFAEFLRIKSARHQSSGKSLTELSGGLENSATFAGDALEIQRRMRNEWN